MTFRKPVPISSDRPTGGIFGDVPEACPHAEAPRATCAGEDPIPFPDPAFTLAVRAANDGLWQWDLTTGGAAYSARWKALLGYVEEQIDGHSEEWLDRIHPEDAPRVKAELQAHVEGATPLFESEHRLRAADGAYRWMLCRGLAARDRAGRASRIGGSLTDLTAAKDAERRLARQALSDRVTGLPNRVFFLELLNRAAARLRRRPNYRFAVLVLDVDRFQVVNESLGHRAGDHLLAALAGRLQSCLRPEDSVARFAGDEFAILLDDVKSVEDAVGVVSRIHRELALSFEVGGHEVFVTASAGIALGMNVEQPEDLLRDAGIAVSRAKARGRGRYEVFDAGMRSRAVALLRLETALRRALDRQEFRLYFQPVVHLGNGGLVGVEALIRWQHPERGLLPPGEFIPLAEETGLIVPIERWVLREACRHARPWQEARVAKGRLPVTVNLSTRQFAQADLLDHVARTLRETGLDPRNLRIEITESALMQSAETANPILDSLRALGIRLSIDDFGTGYSSLSYLHRFPVDVLKIDRSFVSRLGGDGENVEIVRAVLALGRSLGLEVVAEGVETPEQLARLQGLGCAYGQGFHFSPPVDAAAALELIAGWPAAPGRQGAA